MGVLPDEKNCKFYRLISLFWIAFFIAGYPQTWEKPSRNTLRSDTLITVTDRARELVDSLLADEEKTEALIRSLRRQNRADSLLLMEQIKLQNEQRAKLMALGNELNDTKIKHALLKEEIDRIRPKAGDLLIPTAGGIAGFMFTNGDNGQKALVGIGLFALLITLKHFGVY